jgi:hypothetical protein
MLLLRSGQREWVATSSPGNASKKPFVNFDLFNSLLSVIGWGKIPIDPGVDASAIRVQLRSIINSVDLGFRCLWWRIN